MARIKIKDLPTDMKVSRDEMRKIRGGSIIIERKDQRIYIYPTRDLGELPYGPKPSPTPPPWP